MDSTGQTEWMAEQAKALGFDLCGVTSVESYVAGLERIPEWLARGYAGEMKYLHDHRRLDPQRVLPGARSIIVCAMNYNTVGPDAGQNQGSHAAPLHHGTTVGEISRYAWGDDYHNVLGAKLEKLVGAMKAEIAEPFEALWYVDTGPIVERVAAQRAGLGWLAKNTCLINEELGSWLFLGVIVTTLDLVPSSLSPNPQPLAPDLCGNCTMCLDACPTQAFAAPYVLDARKCISYLTIELRSSIPADLREPMGQMVFGCDICQDVCPWNRHAPVSSLAGFQPRRFGSGLNSGTDEIRKSKNETPQQSLLAPGLEWLASLTEEEFREVFHGSAAKRTKRHGLVRNACVALGNALAHPERSGLRPGTEARARAISLLEQLAAGEDELIREHARWALGKSHVG